MTLDPIVVGFLAAAAAVPLSQLCDAEARRDALAVGGAVVLFAAAGLAVSAPLRGTAGGGVAALYTFGAVVLGFRAFQRALSRPILQASELGLALAWAWVVGGGVWLGAYAAGSSLLGFGGSWALLTAAHFHAAGFAAFSVTSLVVRAAGRGRWLLALHPIVFALVAAGLAGARGLDQLGTAGYLGLFAAQWVVALRAGLARRRGGVAVLFALSVPLATLLLALDWALGPRRLDLGQMAWLHGLANALGHGAVGPLGFGRMRPAPRSAPIGAPFSRARARGRVGPEFVAALAPAHPSAPTGLTDDFSRYAGGGFHADRVDARIRRFYERTADYELDARHAWQPGFRLGGALFFQLARRLGQMGLPSPETPAGDMTNAIRDVDDARDGRAGVRAWVRTWKATGETLYAALYSEHVRDGVRYMNIAFPLPWAAMTSLLRLENRDGGHLALTTRRAAGDAGDQGVYLQIAGLGPWRLPVDETITVRTAGAPAAGAASTADLAARHDMWLCGRLFLRLDYRMRRRRGDHPTPGRGARRGHRR